MTVLSGAEGVIRDLDETNGALPLVAAEMDDAVAAVREVFLELAVLLGAPTPAPALAPADDWQAVFREPLFGPSA